MSAAALLSRNPGNGGYTVADLHALPEDESPTIALAELVLDDQTRQYAYRTPYTTGVFTTDRPWPVTVDLPALTKRRERLIRLATRAADG